MINHIWSVLCLHSIINESTRNVSLIEAIEQITITEPSLPKGEEGRLPISFDLVSLWSRESNSQASRGLIRLSFLSPDNVEIKSFDYHVDLSKNLRMHTTTRIYGLSFRGPGIYHFRVQLREENETEWRDVASIPLQIVLQPSESSAIS